VRISPKRIAHAHLSPLSITKREVQADLIRPLNLIQLLAQFRLLLASPGPGEGGPGSGAFVSQHFDIASTAD
jgi:hypothetical protein